jgi:hypothetical protein
MSSSYEFWLSDDAGERICLLQDIAFFSYSRPVSGFGTLQIGFPYAAFQQQVFPLFQPDRRVEVWRSPGYDIPLRHEGTFLLRRHNIYTRITDNVQMIVLYGRDTKDLLRRRWIIQPAGYSQTLKEDYVDDMMKEIVREQMLFGSALDADAVADNSRAYPQDEFSVQGENSLGPIIPATFADRNVLDTLKDLSDATLQLYDTAPLTNKRIYFDILPNTVEQRMSYILEEDEQGAILGEAGEPMLEEASPLQDATIHGFQFMTFADLRGTDRTLSALVFSVENGNLSDPHYTMSHMEEENAAIVKGFGRGDSRAWDEVLVTDRIGESRWNRCEVVVDASTEPDQDRLADYAYPPLHKNAPKEELDATILNTPGGENAPRSLYGVDWDMGDLLPVAYAGKTFHVEVSIVYVAVDEAGAETITGRNTISAGDQ